MRTAIVSDLHLGLLSGEDVLRDAAIRRLLLEEIAGADRVVLLGDVIELRDGPLGDAFEAARPFFAELGEALDGAEVILVPGNHDHRLAEPLLDRLSLSARGGLGLETRFRPGAGPAAKLARLLGDTRLELAYPGVWLRDDVYATHGHYMDCHLSLPRAECLAAAAIMRASGRLPDQAKPEDYERVLRPLYGLSFGIAQSGVKRRPGARPSEAAWKLIAGHENGAGRARRFAGLAAGRVGVPAAVWGLNRLLGASFQSDLSAAAISRSGIAAAAELAGRLQVEAAHVITGHTHRAGPLRGEGPWETPSGSLLHNTGNWIFAAAIHRPGAPPGPYWPGTVTWLEDDGPPRRVRLLDEHSREQLLGITGKGRFRLTSLSARELG